MPSDSLVSVIIIFLNGERFIREAVDSVLAQTHPCWELLLIDDGSTDGSTDTALSYVASHPEKMRYLQHPGHANCGMSAARNLGLRHARGDCVGFLDCDDIWLPPKLEMQLRLFATWPEAGMVCGPTKWWYSWTGKVEDLHRDELRELGMPENTLFHPPTLLERFLRGEVRTPATCSVLLRREVAQTVGGFEEAFREMYEDQAFFVKVFRHARVLATRECWDWYRQHPFSHCAMADLQGPPHWLDANPARQVFLKWVQRYLSDPCPAV